MSKATIRKDLSVLGFCLIFYSVIANLLMILCMAVCCIYLYIRGGMQVSPSDIFQEQMSSNTWFMLSVNAFSQYVIAMPVTAWLIRRFVPTIAVRPELPGYYEKQQDIPGNLYEQYALPEDKFHLRDVPAIAAISFFLMTGGGIIGTGLAELMGDAAGIEAQNDQVELLLSGSLAATILFVVILAPLAEELFFRKFLMDLVKPVSRGGAVFLSAWTFALIHQNIYQFFYAFLLGLLLALIYIKNGKVWLTALLHMCINFFGGIVLPKISTLIPDTESILFDESLSAGWMSNPVILVGCAVYVLLIFTGMIVTILYAVAGRFTVREDRTTTSFAVFLKALLSSPGMIVYLLVNAGIAVVSLLQLI